MTNLAIGKNSFIFALTSYPLLKLFFNLMISEPKHLRNNDILAPQLLDKVKEIQKQEKKHFWTRKTNKSKKDSTWYSEFNNFLVTYQGFPKNG